MKNLNFIFAALIAITFSSNAYAQSPSYSKILKNVNPTAKDLYHDLNASKDSLLFRHNDQEVLRVSFLSHKSKGNKKLDFGKREVSVPLNGFGVGRYTVAVYLSGGEIIVLGLVRLLPIPTKELEKNHEDLRVAKLKTPEKIEIVKRVTKTAPEAKKEEAVVKVTPKPEPVKKAVAKVAPPKKKRSTKVITNPSRKKKVVASAKPKKKVPPTPKGPTLADKLRAKAKRNALAAVEAKKEEIRQRQFDKKIRDDAPKDLNVTKVSYNLSKADSETMVKQSRAEYRKNNLRPNGKPYDD